MSRQIYALFFSFNTVLTAQLKNNHILTTVKETISLAIENNLEEVSTFHKVIRIIYVVTLTLMGIIATIMFTRNILNYQRVQKQFFPKPRTPESTVQSSASLRDEKIDENERKNYGSATTLTNSVSEQSLGLESKSSDFPTVIPSKFRNDAGQDNNVNSISIVQKQRIGWDDIEMMRHGLINCCCVRATPPESTTLPTTINIGNTYSHKMTNSKQIDHISAISESVQNVHPVYTQDFHKSV